MYSPTKAKQEDLPGRASHSRVRRIVPRHTKSYVWLLFIGCVFSLMLLSDHGIPLSDLLPRRQLPLDFDEYAAIPGAHDSIAHAGSDLNSVLSEELTVATTDDDTRSKLASRLNRQPPVSAPTPDAGMTGSTSPQSEKFPVYGTGDKAFTPDDVVILLKTGATALWRRVPMHLSTTLANKTMTPHIVFYSDQADSMAGIPIVDVLANVSTTLKQSADFELYRKLPSVRPNNQYLESASMEGEVWLAGGWRLDKYKFLPLAAHAATYHPGYKWYIYMEDDNYFFWHSLYTWLAANFSPSEPLLLGSPAAKLGEDFAHGGSGMIFSGAGLSKTFGADPDLAHIYEYFAEAHCCGDQVLSHAMAASGVPRYRGYDHTSFIGLQASPTWRLLFGHWNWCSPLLNVHKVHHSDISRLWEFERRFHAERGYGDDAVMDWAYVFRQFIAPNMFSRWRNESDTSEEFSIPDETLIIEEWDNLAAEKWHTSDIEVDEGLSQAEREKKPWFSHKGCAEACQAWDLCLSWKFQDDQCGMSSTVAHGLKVDEGVKMISGFMGKRIRRLFETPECGRSQYIPVA